MKFCTYKTRKYFVSLNSFQKLPKEFNFLVIDGAIHKIKEFTTK